MSVHGLRTVLLGGVGGAGGVLLSRYILSDPAYTQETTVTIVGFLIPLPFSMPKATSSGVGLKPLMCVILSSGSSDTCKLTINTFRLFNFLLFLISLNIPVSLYISPNIHVFSLYISKYPCFLSIYL